MRHPHTLTANLFALFAFILGGALATPAQTNQARSLVTAPVNESQMVMRRGNTHPLARAEFDRGLLGNLVARRCELLDSEADRSLVWWLQLLSWAEGGLPRSARAPLIAALTIRFGSTSPQPTCSGSFREVIRAVFRRCSYNWLMIVIL